MIMVVELTKVLMIMSMTSSHQLTVYTPRMRQTVEKRERMRAEIPAKRAAVCNGIEFLRLLFCLCSHFFVSPSFPTLLILLPRTQIIELKVYNKQYFEFERFPKKSLYYLYFQRFRWMGCKCVEDLCSSLSCYFCPSSSLSTRINILVSQSDRLIERKEEKREIRQTSITHARTTEEERRTSMSQRMNWPPEGMSHKIHCDEQFRFDDLG